MKRDAERKGLGERRKERRGGYVPRKNTDTAGRQQLSVEGGDKVLRRRVCGGIWTN